MRVVPALDELEDGWPGLGRRVNALRIHSSHSRVAMKLSAIASSWQSPTVPIERRTPIAQHRCPKASAVY